MGPASPWLDQSPRAPRGSLSKPPGLTLRLQKGEDISLPDWALHVTHDETVLVVEELDADLGDLSTGSGPSHDLDNNSELQRRLLRVRCQPKKKKKKNTRVFVSGQVPPKRRSLRALRARRQEGSKCGGHNDDQPLGLRARDAGTAPSGVSLAFAPHQTPRTLVVSRTGREKTGGFRACLLKRSRRVAPRRRPSSPPTTSTSLRLRGNRVPYHGYSRVRAPCFSTMHCLPSFWLRPISLGPNAAAGGAVEIGSWKPGNQAKIGLHISMVREWIPV